MEKELVEREKLKTERKIQIVKVFEEKGYCILSTSAEIKLELNKGLGYQ